MRLPGYPASPQGRRFNGKQPVYPGLRLLTGGSTPPNMYLLPIHHDGFTTTTSPNHRQPTVYPSSSSSLPSPYNNRNNRLDRSTSPPPLTPPPNSQFLSRVSNRSTEKLMFRAAESSDSSRLLLSGNDSETHKVATDVVEVKGEALPEQILQSIDPTAFQNDPRRLWFEARFVDVSSTTECSEQENSTTQTTGTLEFILPVHVSHASSVIVMFPDERTANVALEHVRLHSEADSSLTLEDGMTAEVRLMEDTFPAWASCYILHVHELTKEASIQLVAEDESFQFLTVPLKHLRKPNSKNWNFADMGGIVCETVSLPAERFRAITPENCQTMKQRANLLKLTLIQTGPPRAILIGTSITIARAKVLLSGLLRVVQPGKPVQERRQRRLRLLAERREAYEENRVLQFPVNEAHIGLIIGRQGEKLSRIARDYQVELRVLPDDKGVRLVRAYGINSDSLNAARAELEIVYQTVHVDAIEHLLMERQGQLRELAQRAGIYSLWFESNTMILFGTRRCLNSFVNLLDILVADMQGTPSIGAAEDTWVASPSALS